MYIRVVSLHSEALVCRERGEGERGGKGEKERKSVCVSVRGRLGCRSYCARPGSVRCCVNCCCCKTAVAGLQELAGADLGVVLCESDKGFKGL
jgi:hypothetical protein